MGNKLLSGKIEFIQYHKPGLMSGDYEVTVNQTVSEKVTKKDSAAGANPGKAVPVKIPEETFKNTRKFTVAGPRFQLAPQDIYAVFPPPGSLGEHSNVLPHVIFNRSTLPWEREIWADSESSRVKGAGSSASWLALLVFHQDDIEGDHNGKESTRVSQPKVMTLSELQKGSWNLDDNLADTEKETGRAAAFPSFEIRSEQHGSDKATVIDVERNLLDTILPPPADLDYLAHVRQRKTLSVNIDKTYKESLKKCALKETKPAKEVFAAGDYAAFREALKHGGIRLSPQIFCTITARKNGNKTEWVLTNTDNKKQFVARKDQETFLNVFSTDDKEVSADVAYDYLHSLKEELKPGERKSGAEIFGERQSQFFLHALNQAGISLSNPQFARIGSGKNEHWVITTPDGPAKQYFAKEIRRDFLNVFTNDAEVGIVVANRLPTPNGLSTVHLVSLEDRYGSSDKAFHHADPATDYVRLVSLRQWSFSCTRPARTFKEIIKALDRDTLQLNVPEDSAKQAGGNATKKKKEENAELLRNLEKGYVPLRHYLRKGDKTVSWYHSPLLPWRNTERLYGLVPDNTVSEQDFQVTSSQHGGWTFKGDNQYWVERNESAKVKFRAFKVNPCFGSHPRVSDQLLRLDQASGVFDTTYAAAWKLGRLMALEDKRFSVALTNWKRTCAQHAHRFEQAGGDLHLHADEHPELVSSLAPPPPEVSTWFDQRNVLKGVPFNYLVPDSRMLSEESIRFFEVDPLWMDCLLDGAFSLGRVTEVDHQQDFLHIIADNRYPRMSGVLIRSEAVPGWPGMLVDAFYKIPNNVELFGPAREDKSTPGSKPKLRKAMEAIGLPLPREFSVKLSDDLETCTLNDLDTNPQYVDTVVGEDSVPPDPQLCLMMPDRDRQYHYTFINEGTPSAKRLYLKLPLLRQERLGNGVLICLFQGAIERVDVHLKPETLHFGLKRGDRGEYSKELKDESGVESGKVLESTMIPWKWPISEVPGGGTLEIANLAGKIKTTTGLKKITSARFALQMIEGNELVRFSVKKPG